MEIFLNGPLKFTWICKFFKNTDPVVLFTVESLIMNSPNSQKPLIIKVFQCTICILFNRFVPLNKENLPIMKKVGCPNAFIIQRFHCTHVCTYIVLCEGLDSPHNSNPHTSKPAARALCVHLQFYGEKLATSSLAVPPAGLPRLVHHPPPLSGLMHIRPVSLRHRNM